MRLHPLLIPCYLFVSRLCSAMCPTTCSCKQTGEGKRAVYCGEGAMDSIPVDRMERGMQVLELTVPEGGVPNHFPVIGQIFQKFRQLEELRIRDSGVQQIGVHAFWGVPSLIVLDLSCNNISGISAHNFRGLVNLVELHLGWNKISDLVMGVFSYMTELRILTLQYNRLSVIVPRLFIKLGNLQVLKLSGNRFKELNPDAFKDVVDLRVLECRGCSLKRINTQIYHILPYLTHLDLGNNRIQYFHREEFEDLRRVKTLKLDGNMLSVILEKIFAHQHLLQSLCLSRNRLALITDTAFHNLTSLISLDISYNKMYKLDAVAMEPIAETLERLSISGNRYKMEMVKACLQTLHNVKYLEMADLNVSEVPVGFLPERIKQLNLSGNNLKTLEVEALPRQLVELDLSRNGFFGLNESVLVRLERLVKVRFEGNPWACDICHIMPILARANKSRTLRNIVCASPNSLKGRTISSLRIEDVKACEDGNTSGGEFMFVFNHLGLIIGIGVVIILFVVFLCILLYAKAKRRRPNRRGSKEEHKIVREGGANSIYGNNEEIAFKFSLDLTEQTVSVSTITETKKDVQLHILPNGTGI